MSETRPPSETWRSFVPAADDIFTPPPAPTVAPDSKPATETNLGFVVTIANVLITGIIVTAMLIDGQQAGRAILVGSAYFALTMAWFALVLTGAMSTIIAALARERTERKRIDAYQDLGQQAIEWRRVVEDNRRMELQAQAMPTQLARRIAALETELLEQRVRTPPAQGTAYVAPYDNRSRAAHVDTEAQVDTTANEAIAWLNSLYDDLGNADRAKVQSDGRLKIRMIGSSRGPGSRDAGLWLIDRGVINKVPGGFALNLTHFRTRESVRNLL